MSEDRTNACEAAQEKAVAAGNGGNVVISMGGLQSNTVTIRNAVS
jgi:hypothetical protein